MQNIAIMTDTNSGISREEADKIGIHMISMPVLINGKTYFEGIDLTHDELNDFMKNRADVSTSQPSVGEVIDMWDNLLKEYENVIYIPMSSGLSGSYNTSAALASSYDGRVLVANTHRVSITMRHCIYDAVSLLQQDKTAQEIVSCLENNAYNSVVYLGVDTLDYFKKSGRVTPRTAAIATVLNIKPVLISEGEKFDTFAKVRGAKACREKILEATKKYIQHHFAGISPGSFRIATAGSFETKEAAESWRTQVQNAFPEIPVGYDELSCSIVCHTGLNSAGIGISKII